MKFENKVALVTGGHFGIGRAIAQHLASEGAAVAIVARNEERANRVVNEINDAGGRATYFKADVSSEVEIKSMIDAVVGHYDPSPMQVKISL